MHVKNRVFRTPSNRISHIVRTANNQLPAKSGIFCLLVEVVYWPCSLKFVYPMINLAFLERMIKVKLRAKFCLHSFEWFCLQISSDAKYFPSLVQGIVIYFQIWKKKEHNSISSRILSCHMGPMYIEIPGIHRMLKNWYNLRCKYRRNYIV